MVYLVDDSFSDFDFKGYGNFFIIKKDGLELEKRLEIAKKNEESSLDSIVFLTNEEALKNNLDILTGDEFDILKKLNLSYLEKEKGIETMGGLEFIYKKVIACFLTSTKEFYDQLIDKYNASLDAYLLFTHSIKGISLNLGSDILYKITKLGMKETYYKNHSFLSFFNDVFKSVYDQLEKYYNESSL